MEDFNIPEEIQVIFASGRKSVMLDASNLTTCLLQEKRVVGALLNNDNIQFQKPDARPLIIKNSSSISFKLNSFNIKFELLPLFPLEIAATISITTTIDANDKIIARIPSIP
jgi:hypothetical protein